MPTDAHRRRIMPQGMPSYEEWREQRQVLPLRREADDIAVEPVTTTAGMPSYEEWREQRAVLPSRRAPEQTTETAGMPSVEEWQPSRAVLPEPRESSYQPQPQAVPEPIDPTTRRRRIAQQMLESERKPEPTIRELMFTESTVSGDVFRTLGGLGTAVTSAANAMAKGLFEIGSKGAPWLKIAGVDDKIKDWFTDNEQALSEQLVGISEEIGRQGGVPAQVAQEIGQRAAVAALRLMGLKALPKTKSTLLNTARFATITALTTPGTLSERGQAAVRAAILTSTPIPAKGITNLLNVQGAWKPVVATMLDTMFNTSAGVGFDQFNKVLGQETRNYDWSKPEVFIPSLLEDFLFSLGTGVEVRAQQNAITAMRDPAAQAMGREAAEAAIARAEQRTAEKVPQDEIRAARAEAQAEIVRQQAAFQAQKAEAAQPYLDEAARADEAGRPQDAEDYRGFADAIQGARTARELSEARYEVEQIDATIQARKQALKQNPEQGAASGRGSEADNANRDTIANVGKTGSDPNLDEQSRDLGLGIKVATDLRLTAQERGVLPGEKVDETRVARDERVGEEDGRTLPERRAGGQEAPAGRDVQAQREQAAEAQRLAEREGLVAEADREAEARLEAERQAEIDADIAEVQRSVLPQARTEGVPRVEAAARPEAEAREGAEVGARAEEVKPPEMTPEERDLRPVAQGKTRVYHATDASIEELKAGIQTSMERGTSHGDVVHVTKFPSTKYGKRIVAIDVPSDEVKMQSKSEFRIERPISAEEITGVRDGDRYVFKAEAKPEAKAPELMKQDEFVRIAEMRVSGQSVGKTRKIAQSAHAVYVLEAIKNHSPVLADNVDRYGYSEKDKLLWRYNGVEQRGLPDGYTRDGDRYVFKAEAKPEAKAPELMTPESTERSDASLISEWNVPFRSAEVPVSKLQLSKDVPQFKEDVIDKTTGETEPLSGKFTRFATPPIVIWERNDGRMEIVTGRHRWALAKRSGETTIPSHIVREADGFTKQMAITVDAISNIRDGQGKVSDYANFFRNTEISQEEASSRGLFARNKGKSGWIIGKLASDDLYAMYRQGSLGESKTVAIASGLPNQPERQASAATYAKTHNTDQVIGFVRASKIIPPSPSKQLDLLGWDRSEMERMEALGNEAARIMSETKTELKALQTAKALTGEKKKTILQKYGFNISDTDKLDSRIQELLIETDRWNNWDMHSDLVQRVSEGIRSKYPDISDAITKTQVTEPARKAAPGELFPEPPLTLVGNAATTPAGRATEAKLAQERAAEERKATLERQAQDLIPVAAEPEAKPPEERIAIVNKVAPDYHPSRLLTSISLAEDLKQDVYRLKAKARNEYGQIKLTTLSQLGDTERALSAIEYNKRMAQENERRPLRVGDKVWTHFNEIIAETGRPQDKAENKPMTVRKVNPKTAKVVSDGGVEFTVRRSSIVPEGDRYVFKGEVKAEVGARAAGVKPEGMTPEEVAGLITSKPTKLKMLHGTRSEFDEFDRPSYFIDNMEEAMFYAQETSREGVDRSAGKPRVVESEIETQNPLVVRTKENPTNFLDKNEDRLIRKVDEGEHDSIVVVGINDGKQEVVVLTQGATVNVREGDRYVFKGEVKAEVVARAEEAKPPELTQASVINRDYETLKKKHGEKWATKYFQEADRLLNPNRHEIVEYRDSGMVTKEGDAYTFHALADMDSLARDAKWRISFKRDVSEQFKPKPVIAKTETPPDAYAIGQRVRMKDSPRTGVVVEILKQTAEEAENGEIPLKVRFGAKIDTVFADLDVVPVKGAAPKPSAAAASQDKLNQELTRLGMDPTAFKTKKEKQAAIKRAESKAKPEADVSRDNMIVDALRWQGAHLNAESEYSMRGDRKGQFAVAKTSGKSQLDDYLMKRFGVDRNTAHDISNEITSRDLPADTSARPDDFRGEHWADKTITDRPAAPAREILPTPRAEPEAKQAKISTVVLDVSSDAKTLATAYAKRRSEATGKPVRVVTKTVQAGDDAWIEYKVAGHTFKRDGLRFTIPSTVDASEWNLAVGFDSKYRIAAEPTREIMEARPRRGKNIDEQRIQKLGTTTDLREAGYITEDGRLIDLSGKSEGGTPGKRAYDHREAGGTKGMQEFQAEGNIRIDSVSGRIDIAREPTAKQYAMLERLINTTEAGIVLDIASGLGRETDDYYLPPSRQWSQIYREGIKPARVLNNIKNFYAGKEMPSDISISAGRYYSLARPQDPTAPKPAGVAKADAQKQVDQLSAKWKNKPKGGILVVERADIDGMDISPESKQSLRDSGAEGFYDIKNDRVVIIGDNLARPEDVTRVALHETIGHKGLRAVLGERLDSELLRLGEGIDRAELEAIAREYGVDLKTQKGMLVAVEEHIARNAEAQPTRWQSFRSFVKRMLEGLGLSKETVDTWFRTGEIDRLVEESRLAIARGTPGEAARADEIRMSLRREDEVRPITGTIKSVQDRITPQSPYRITIETPDGKTQEIRAFHDLGKGAKDLIGQTVQIAGKPDARGFEAKSITAMEAPAPAAKPTPQPRPVLPPAKQPVREPELKFAGLDTRGTVYKAISDTAKAHSVSEKRLAELSQDLTGSPNFKKAKTRDLVTILAELRKDRPEPTGKDTSDAISFKTEHELKQALDTRVRSGKLTQEIFNEIKQQQIDNIREEMKSRGTLTPEREAELQRSWRDTPEFVSKRVFATEAQGQKLLRQIVDTERSVMERMRRDQAALKNPVLAQEIDRVDTIRRNELEKKVAAGKLPGDGVVGVKSLFTDVRHFWGRVASSLADPDVVGSYYRLAHEKKTSESAIDRRMRSVWEGIKPAEANALLKSQESAKRIEDYVASNGESKPEGMTPTEKTVGDRMIAAWKEYQPNVRWLRFMEWYHNRARTIPDAPDKDLTEAVRLLEVEGMDSAKKFLDEKTWGVIEQGYMPVDLIRKATIIPQRETMEVGRQHLHAREAMNPDEQDRTIFQKFSSYVRRMENLTRVQPELDNFDAWWRVSSSKFNSTDMGKLDSELQNWYREMLGRHTPLGPLERYIQRAYGQAALTIFNDLGKGVRNLFQAPAMHTNISDLFRMRKLSPADLEYFNTYVNQTRGIQRDLMMSDTPGWKIFAPLNKIMAAINVMGRTDTANRYIDFAASISRVNRALRNNPNYMKTNAALQKLLTAAGIGDLTAAEAQHAKNLLMTEGAESFARFIAKSITEKDQFVYNRWERGLGEQGTDYRKIMSNLFVFPKGYAQRVGYDLAKITSKVEREIGGPAHVPRRAAHSIIGVMAMGAVASSILQIITGSKRRPYDPQTILSGIFGFGGLVTGTQQKLSSFASNIATALSGGEEASKALGRAINDISGMGESFVPFYREILRAYEGFGGYNNADRMMLRQIRSKFDERYNSNIEYYERERTLLETGQHVLFGTQTDRPKPKPKYKSRGVTPSEQTQTLLKERRKQRESMRRPIMPKPRK